MNRAKLTNVASAQKPIFMGQTLCNTAQVEQLLFGCSSSCGHVDSSAHLETKSAGWLAGLAQVGLGPSPAK